MAASSGAERQDSSVAQLLVAAVISMAVDQLPGLAQGRPVAERSDWIQENVGLIERHRAVLSDFPNLGQVRFSRGTIAVDVAQPCAGEEAAQYEFQITGVA